MNRFIIKVMNRDKLTSMMINGTGPGKPSVFYIGWHNFVPMQNTLWLSRMICSLIEQNCRMLFHLIQGKSQVKLYPHVLPTDNIPSIGFLAKKYFVKGIRFKMNPLLNVKDDGWFQWTNILQITIRHSAQALVSSFQEMLLKSSWKPQKQPTIFAFQMYTWPVSYDWSRSYQIQSKQLQDCSVFYHYKW